MKKTYNQPTIQIAQIATCSIICASGTPRSSGAGKVNTGVSTDSQW